LRVAAPPLTKPAHRSGRRRPEENIGSNCGFTHPAMIEYDDPHRAAYRGHFAGIEGSNLARSPAPEERQSVPIPGGALTRT